jgi:AcrR family transcriptional regulator
VTARERVLEAAYELFTRHGIRAVGIDRIIAESGVAKMTLYRHFGSKEELVLAFLELRQQRWAREWLIRTLDAIAAQPRDRALAVFDALDSWFSSEDFESCPLIGTLMETRSESGGINAASVSHLDEIRMILSDQAQLAGAADPEATGYQLHILAIGAIVSATRGDLQAARRARALAEPLFAPAA